MNRIFSKHNLVTAVLLFALLLPMSNLVMFNAAAQGTVATVIIMPTTGGTTDPTPGQYTYENGTNIIFAAVPNAGYRFSYWLVTGEYIPGHTSQNVAPSQIIDPETGEIISFPLPPRPSPGSVDTQTFTANPANITCGYGYSYTYTAFFEPIAQPSPTPGPTEGVIIVMPTVGGTVTPAAGSYTHTNGTIFEISANPDAGYVFKYWLVSGSVITGHETAYSVITDDQGNVISEIPRATGSAIDSLTFTDNPARITCGYGYTYTYTAFFEQASATSTPPATSTPTATASPTQQTASPSPTSTPTQAATDWTTWIIVAVVVVVIIIVIAAAILMRKKP